MPRTIKIPKGSTLSGLAKQYNTSINELMALNPTIKDPDKIFAGANLSVPTLAGTLNKLPTETPGEPSLGSNILPDQPSDRLSIFGDVLKMVTNRAVKESIARGGEALPGSFLKPSQVSGGSFANVLNTIREQKTRGIADIYTSTIDLLERQRKSSMDQLSLLIKEGGLAQLNDEQITQLASSTGMEFDHLMGIRNAQEKAANAPKSFSIVDRSDGKYRLGFDASGNIISEIKIAEPRPEEDKDQIWDALTPTIKGDILGWISIQDGFEPDWIKKMDSDPEFSNFIISKYYQSIEE